MQIALVLIKRLALVAGGFCLVSTTCLAAEPASKTANKKAVAAADVPVETGLIQRHRVAIEQRLLAFAAVWRAGQLVPANAVGGVAMRADKV